MHTQYIGYTPRNHWTLKTWHAVCIVFYDNAIHTPKGNHTMLTLQTHDETLHGYKYCIADNHGNLIAVLPTKESQAREYEAIGIDSDLMIEVMFMPYMAQS